jgi:Smg protein
MFDVLVYLYEHYSAASAWPDSDALTRKLAAAGFDQSEIDDALAWLQGLARVTQDQLSVRDAGADTFRVYTAFERERLGTEAVAFLAFLEAEGQLSGAQREIVIERALAAGLADEPNDAGHPVPLHRIKLIVLMVLWSQQADIDILLLEELLDDGDDRLLH